MRAAIAVLAGGVATVAVTAALAAAPALASPPVPRTVAWGPGSLIAFGAYAGASSRGGIYVVRSDGTGLHRLTTLGGGDSNLRWSPDRRTLLFDADLKLYSIRADGTHLHAFGAGFYGVWSPDGGRIAFERADGVYVMRPDGSGVHRLRIDFDRGDPPRPRVVRAEATVMVSGTVIASAPPNGGRTRT